MLALCSILLASVVLVNAVIVYVNLPCPLPYYLAAWKATRYQVTWPISRADYNRAKQFAAARKGAWGAAVSSMKVESATRVTFRITQQLDERGNSGGLEYILQKTREDWGLADSGFWHELHSSGTGRGQL